MNKFEERTINFANFIVKNKATIRSTARTFRYSKSTVFNDIKNRLKTINNKLYNQVKNILNTNFNEKHLRGGLATKNKYLKLKNKKIKQTKNNK